MEIFIFQCQFSDYEFKKCLSYGEKFDFSPPVAHWRGHKIVGTALLYFYVFWLVQFRFSGIKFSRSFIWALSGELCVCTKASKTSENGKIEYGATFPYCTISVILSSLVG